MLFFLAGANGRPLWWNSAIPSFVLASMLVFSRGPEQVLNAALNRRNRSTFTLLFLILTASLFSTLANSNVVSWEALLFRCAIPLLIYLSLVGVSMRREDMLVLVMALALGAAIPFGRGAIAFYREWGIPDLQTFLWARYNVPRMEKFGVDTFGNIGHMGSYAVLFLPAILLALRGEGLGRPARVVLLVIAAFGVSDLLISGARTAFVVSCFAFTIGLLGTGRIGRRSVFLLFAFLALYLLFSNVGAILDRTILVDRFIPELGARGIDTSAQERFASIAIGWQTFVEHPFLGVGPGMSPDYNPYFIPHLSVIHILSEIGLLGGFAFALLNILVFARVGKSAFRAASDDQQQRVRFFWLIGPACWFLHGLIGGLTFNMDLALLWIGSVHAMLALSEASILPPLISSREIQWGSTLRS